MLNNFQINWRAARHQDFDGIAADIDSSAYSRCLLWHKNSSRETKSQLTIEMQPGTLLNRSE
jgi:hypothetical protein